MPNTGTPASKRPASTCGAPSAYTEEGPPDRMMAAGSLASSSSTGSRVRHDLGVDVRLAHPAGDQLGVLGAVVDDEHRPVRPLGEPLGGVVPGLGRALAGRAVRQDLVGGVARPARPGVRVQTGRDGEVGGALAHPSEPSGALAGRRPLRRRGPPHPRRSGAAPGR